MAGAFVGSVILTVILVVVLHIPIAFLLLPIIPFVLRTRRRSTVKRSRRVDRKQTTRAMTTARATAAR